MKCVVYKAGAIISNTECHYVLVKDGCLLLQDEEGFLIRGWNKNEWSRYETRSE